jgi:hypothetical protein
MPQPTLTEVHTDALLTNISIAYAQKPGNFVYDKVFPFVPVAKKSDKYRTYTKADFLRTDAERLGPGAHCVETGFGVSSTSYVCDVFGIGAFVDDQLQANWDGPDGPEEMHAKNLMADIMLQQEIAWMTTFFGTSIWGTDKTVGAADKWDVATSDPKDLVNDGKETILAATGFEPNTMVIDYRVFNSLTEHPLIQNQFKYTSAESVNEAMLARFFGVDRLLVIRSVKNASNEGATSPSYTMTSGKHGLLCYVPSTPSLATPAAGYTFVWTGLTGINNVGIRSMRYENAERRGVKIEVHTAYDQKVIASDVGYFFSGLVS